MTRYLEADYQGAAFDLFGAGHLIAMALVAGIVAYLVWGWQRPTEAGKRRARLLIVSAMIANEIAWQSWNIAYGTWSLGLNLPLHLCGVSIYSTMYMLLTRDYRPFEIIFFVGLVGGSQALITPPAGEYGLPHFRAFQTLMSHGMLVIALVFIAAVEGRRPTWASIWKTMLALNVYLVIVSAINYLLDSNYMFTMRKPDTASLFDHMGPWPWYLLTAEFLALALFVLLYLPFALRKPPS